MCDRNENLGGDPREFGDMYLCVYIYIYIYAAICINGCTQAQVRVQVPHNVG